MNSVPKAGTYLCAAILEELGFIFTHWHLAFDHYDDYSLQPKQEKRVLVGSRINSPLPDTLEAVPDNHITVGHLFDNSIPFFKDWFVVYLYRDTRTAAKSLNKWRIIKGQQPINTAREIKRIRCKQNLWPSRANVELDFEQLKMQVGVDILASQLGRERFHYSIALEKETLTKNVAPEPI